MIIHFYGLFIGPNEAQTLEVDWLYRPFLVGFPILLRSHHQEEVLPPLGRVVTTTYYDELMYRDEQS